METATIVGNIVLFATYAGAFWFLRSAWKSSFPTYVLAASALLSSFYWTYRLVESLV